LLIVGGKIHEPFYRNEDDVTFWGEETLAGELEMVRWVGLLGVSGGLTTEEDVGGDSAACIRASRRL